MSVAGQISFVGVFIHIDVESAGGCPLQECSTISMSSLLADVSYRSVPPYRCPYRCLDVGDSGGAATCRKPVDGRLATATASGQPALC